MTSGGERVADVLVRERVPRLFTLCGGHIAPILVAAKARGIDFDELVWRILETSLE